MTEPVCPCGRPIPDMAYVCHDCGRKAEYALKDYARFAADLDLAVYRIARTGNGDGGRRSAEPPLPFAYPAWEARNAVENTITTWAQVVVEERGQEPDDPRPRIVALWLIGQIAWLRHREYAEQAVDELRDAGKQVIRAIDRMGERTYAGPCDWCGHDVYARLGAATATCQHRLNGVPCGREYDMDARRTWLLEQAEDTLAPASLIARAVTALGEPVTPERVRQWACRSRLIVRGRLGDRPTYRVGDVIDLVREDARREATRAAKRRKPA